MALRDAIFHQRPLKPAKPGKCTFNPAEERAPAALPSVEARVIYETLNALRYGEGVRRDKPLNLQQRNLLATKLLNGGDWTFDQIRSGLKLPASIRFSLEDSRKDIKGAATANRLRKKDAFGSAWARFDLAAKDRIVELLLEEEDEEALVATLDYGTQTRRSSGASHRECSDARKPRPPWPNGQRTHLERT